MGKTFRKDSSHNKFNRRDREAKRKFSEKFLKPIAKKTKVIGIDLIPKDIKYPEND